MWGPWRELTICIRGGKDNHLFLMKWIIDFVVLRDKEHTLAIQQSCWGNSYLGFLPPHERPLEELIFIFIHILAQGQSILFHHNVILAVRGHCVVGVAVEASTTSLRDLICKERSLHLMEISLKSVIELNCRFW